VKWIERLSWLAAGVALGAPVYPIAEFITQAVLGHSPLNPKETV
jgi:hypothetical protein